MSGQYYMPQIPGGSMPPPPMIPVIPFPSYPAQPLPGGMMPMPQQPPPMYPAAPAGVGSQFAPSFSHYQGSSLVLNPSAPVSTQPMFTPLFTNSSAWSANTQGRVYNQLRTPVGHPSLACSLNAMKPATSNTQRSCLTDSIMPQRIPVIGQKQQAFPVAINSNTEEGKAVVQIENKMAEVVTRSHKPDVVISSPSSLTYQMETEGVQTKDDLYRKFGEVIREYGPLEATNEKILNIFINLTALDRKVIMVQGSIKAFLAKCDYIDVQGNTLQVTGDLPPLREEGENTSSPLTQEGRDRSSSTDSFPMVDSNGFDVESMKFNLFRRFEALLEDGPLEVTSQKVLNMFLKMSSAERRLVMTSGGIADFISTSDCIQVQGKLLKLRGGNLPPNELPQITSEMAPGLFGEGLQSDTQTSLSSLPTESSLFPVPSMLSVSSPEFMPRSFTSSHHPLLPSSPEFIPSCNASNTCPIYTGTDNVVPDGSHTNGHIHADSPAYSSSPSPLSSKDSNSLLQSPRTTLPLSTDSSHGDQQHNQLFGSGDSLNGQPFCFREVGVQQTIEVHEKSEQTDGLLWPPPLVPSCDTVPKRKFDLVVERARLAEERLISLQTELCIQTLTQLRHDILETYIKTVRAPNNGEVEKASLQRDYTNVMRCMQEEMDRVEILHDSNMSAVRDGLELKALPEISFTYPDVPKSLTPNNLQQRYKGLQTCQDHPSSTVNKSVERRVSECSADSSTDRKPPGLDNLQELKIKKEYEESSAEHRNSHSTVSSEHSGLPDTSGQSISGQSISGQSRDISGQSISGQSRDINSQSRDTNDVQRDNPLAKFFPGLDGSLTLPVVPGNLKSEALYQQIMMMPNARMFMPGIYGQTPILGSDQLQQQQQLQQHLQLQQQLQQRQQQLQQQLQQPQQQLQQQQQLQLPAARPQQESPSIKEQSITDTSVASDAHTSQNDASVSCSNDQAMSSAHNQTEVRTVSRKSRKKASKKLPDVNANFNAIDVESSGHGKDVESSGHGKDVKSNEEEVAQNLPSNMAWGNPSHTWSKRESWDSSSTTDSQSRKVPAKPSENWESNSEVEENVVEAVSSRYYATPMTQQYSLVNDVMSDMPPGPQVASLRRPLPVLHSSISTVPVTIVPPGVPKGYSFVPEPKKTDVPEPVDDVEFPPLGAQPTPVSDINTQKNTMADQTNPLILTRKVQSLKKSHPTSAVAGISEINMCDDFTEACFWEPRLELEDTTEWQQVGRKSKKVGSDATEAPVSSNFEKLLHKIQTSHPQLTRQDALEVVNQVRVKHGGLKGVSIAQILADAAEVIKDMKTAGSSESAKVEDLNDGNLLYKTSICVFWQQGKCTRTTKECVYAHGKKDLHILPKNVMCQNIIKKGTCPYADKCVFAHSKEEKKKAQTK